MIGGAPMMTPFAPAYPPGSYPALGATYPRQPYEAPPAVWQAPASGGTAWAQQQAPRPIFRGKGADEPAAPLQAAVARLSMPSPDQLGVSRPNGADTDWTTVKQRLDRLSPSYVHMDRVQGGYRFTCLLPTTKADRTHRVEALAATEAEAVRLALNKCEEWAGGRRQ